MQKVIIAVLAAALIAVCSIWGYSAWSKRQGAPAVEQAAPVVGTAPADASQALPEENAPSENEDAVSEPEQAPAPVDRSQLAGGTEFIYEYVPPRNSDLSMVYEFTTSLELLERLPEVNSLSGALMLPRPLRILTAECQAVNAFYSPGKGELVLCYEMIDSVLKQGDGIAKSQGFDEQYAARYLMANLRFIMLHEMGHALIDLLDLSAVGREEDAADQLAVTLMLQFIGDEPASQVAENLNLAGIWFILNSAGGEAYDTRAYADEHSLGEQRYFNLMCMLYGDDPGKYLSIVTSGKLPEARAHRCPEESKRITTSWSRLLLPHIAPRYRYSLEEAQEILEKARREQETEHSQSPYVRGE